MAQWQNNRRHRGNKYRRRNKWRRMAWHQQKGGIEAA